MAEFPPVSRRNGKRSVGKGDRYSYLVSEPSGNEPKKRTMVVFIHGASAGAWYWERFLGYTASVGYLSVAPDILGHGTRYPHPQLGTLSINDYVADVADFISAEFPETDPKNIVLVGHSMGGLIVQKLVETFPVRALALIASAPPSGVRFRKGNVSVPIKELIMAGVDMALGNPIMVPRCLFDKLFPHHTASDRDAMYALFTPESSRAGREIVTGDIVVDPEAMTMPCLVISAGDDRIINSNVGKDIATYYGTSAVEFSDRGHMLIIEEPGWRDVARRLTDWLALNQVV
jgi:pimeloyl-ACP methyl ester carboxylesterase